MSLNNISQTLLAYERCSQAYILCEGTDQECRSWDGAQLEFDGARGVLPNIPSRKLNVPYAVQEFLWYCRGNRYDKSILEHATMWKKLVQADEGINSNYGQYLFVEYETPVGFMQSQFDTCVGELVQNEGSRRATMVLLNTGHMYSANTDMVCTYALQFFIRNGKLDMHVFMRSNDVVWGLTNDAFCFNMIQRMVCQALRMAKYPRLAVGRYVHTAATLHVYKRHYSMVRDAFYESDKYVEVNPPMIDELDLEALRFDQSASGGAFMEWARNVCQPDSAVA